jgi:succinate dehydrogenase / fumarate reductase cytochrome b subunit
LHEYFSEDKKVSMSLSKVENISSTFIWRRVHSLMGLWLVIYLFEHLVVNSQATLWIGDDGSIFIKMVNLLESLPFLRVIEWLLIGIPLLIHGVWGVKRALEPKLNSFGGGAKDPHLPYGRNSAFTWQRLTSWVLLVGIIGHVVQMRFLGHPTKIEVNDQVRYLNRVSFDPGLYTLSARLHVTLYSEEEIAAMKKELVQEPKAVIPSGEYSEAREKQVDQDQRATQQRKWIEKLSSFQLHGNEVIAEANTPGTAMLLMVRDHFKSPLIAVLYTIFVLAAAFHAFNGFWTALITWGAMLSYRSQKAMIPVSAVGIAVLSFLGLAAIWGSYWINLRS